MPERPLLIHPYPENVDVPAGHGGGGMPPHPTMNDSRKKKFSDKFESAINYIQSIAGNVNPEMVLVIETIGKIQDFHKAVNRIEGLEWLAEADIDDLEIDDDIYEDNDDRIKASKAGGRLYLISSNRSSLVGIRTLWQRYSYNMEESLGYGNAKWKDAFKYIHELRYWNEKDRLEETGILKYWEKEIEAKRGTDSIISFEIELHFRRDGEQGERVEQDVIGRITQGRGEVIKKVRIPEIGLHALKISMQVDDVSTVRDSYLNKEFVSLIKSDYIKYFRPIPQQLVGEGEDEIRSSPDDRQFPYVNKKPPVIALFDGFPLSNHSWLTDRIIVDDPDTFGGTYEAAQQKHGTSMASLICHEDLGNPNQESLPRKIYVRPIMQPCEFSGREMIPSDEFPEDLVERAVVRIFEEQKEENTGVAPTIRVINLSLGHLDHPFLGEMSSWARLLDWLSWKYKVLFVVSAGNCDEMQTLDGDENISMLEQTIKQMGKTIRNRKILSPAESMNALTVGALHFDHSGVPANGPRIDIFEGKSLMAEYSRLGSGYRRSIKPDILVAGGRQMFSRNIETNGNINFKESSSSDAPGQKSAYIGHFPEDITNTAYTRGTSNATAITTHAAGLLYEVIEDLRSDNPEKISKEYEGVLLKSLLTHSASWGVMEEKLEILKNPTNSRRFKRIVSQYLGYGKADFSRVMECTAQRVTMIGLGKLKEKNRHRFVLPVPDACQGIHYKLIATLAYFTPINPFHFNYRTAKVFFECDLSKDHRQEADYQQVRNGTIQHEILNLENIDSDIEIFVQCNSDATDSLDEEIPYALSLTLEAEQETNIDIYEEIRQQIETSVVI